MQLPHQWNLWFIPPHATISISVLKNCGECHAEGFWTQDIPKLFQKTASEVALESRRRCVHRWNGLVWSRVCIWTRMFSCKVKIPVGLAFVCLGFPLFLSQRADFFFFFFLLNMVVLFLQCFFQVKTLYKWLDSYSCKRI